MHIYVTLSIILIIIFVTVYFGGIYEYFGEPSSVKQIPDIIDLSKQFDDIIVYDNDETGRIGIDKCVEYCNGYCVDHGMTGSSYCFPVKEPVKKDFYSGFAQNGLKISFPNVS